MASTNPSSNDHIIKTIYNCDRHSAMISEKLLAFYDKNELFDTFLIAGTDCVSIQAHKIVLCAFSEYFLHIFRTNKSNVIELKEIDAATLKPIIDFMYKGSIELCLKTVETFLRTASFLKMNTLIHGCCEFIEKNMNCNKSLKWLQLANELNLSTLKDKSLKCTYSNFKKILKKKELLKLSESELKDLLFINNPHTNLGEQIFMCLVAWINYDKPNREHLVIELLSMVNFQTLTPKFILKNRKSVCKNLESYELICSWLQWHLLPETRFNDQAESTSKAKKNKRKKQRRNKKNKPNQIGIICMKESKVIIKSWNPEENSWLSVIETSIDELNPSTIVIDNKLIFVGRPYSTTNTVKCLDLDTVEWIHFPQMNTDKRYCQLEYLNGHLFVIGEDVFHQTSLELFNFSTNKWHDLQPLSPLAGLIKITSHNGILYILDSENEFLQTFEVASYKWTCTKIRFPHNRCGYFLTGFGFAATEQYLYIIGGNYVSYCGYDRFNACNGLYRYDLISNCWDEMTYKSKIRDNIESIVYKNKIIICDLEEVDEYDIETDTWNTLGPLPVEYCDTCCLTYI
ncbi:kelch-like protein 4 [Episyrphus balteatus]|uniref:kelch-like protein 4 n=1 Tax=Episyrphus balteatus TaxID=286459 RepID=UPI0024850CCF|nr:kelch-like protein 4 [Episyrphus balteatus]